MVVSVILYPIPSYICLKIFRIKMKKEKKNIAGISFCQSQGTLRKNKAHILHISFGGFHLTKERVHLPVPVYVLSVFSARIGAPQGWALCFVHWLSKVPPLSLAPSESSIIYCYVNVPHIGGQDVYFHFTDENTEAFRADVLAQDHIAG